MADDLGFGITLALRDAFSKNANRIEGSYRSLDSTIAASSEKINQNLERVQKGAMLMGAGIATLALPAALAKSTFETQKALGEMRSLGIKDLNALALAAEDFSNRWSDTTKAEFIAASYDIKSGIASLSDFAVGEFSKIAALTGKATKSSTAEMTSLFATGYGIYKTMYGQMSDIAFGEMFSGGIAAAVQAYKTTGSGMAESISRLGAIATTANIPLEEQLSILGMLQATMSGSEAGTKYKAFMKSAAKAGEALGLQFTDQNNQMMGMIPILQTIRKKYGETMDAMEKQELQKAFGRIEALEVVDLFYNKIGDLTGNIGNMGKALRTGTTLTEEMAAAMNQDPGSMLKLIGQQAHNLFEILGKTLLPILKPIFGMISSIVLGTQKLAKTFPGLTRVVLGGMFAIGGLLTVGGMLLMSLGALGMAIPAANTALAAMGITATITGASIKATLLSAFWPVTIGIAAVYALKKAWDANLGGVQDKVRNLWHTVSTVWDGISSLISSGKVSGAMHDELQKMGLWDFVKNIYMVYYRLEEFFSGVYSQVKSAFSSLGEAVYPVFSGIYAVIAPVGKLLLTLAQAFGFVGASIPSGAFKTFGQVIGFVVGIPLRILGGMIKTITVPLEYLGKALGWVIDKIASAISMIPEFLLPKDLAGLKGKLTAGAMSVSMMATPAIAATPAIKAAPTIAAHQSQSVKPIVPSQPSIAVYPEIPVTPPVASPLTVAVYPTVPVVPVEIPSPGVSEKTSEPSRFSQLLAEKNNNYYQTFNNQRTESTNIAQPPQIIQDQRPLEIKLHLDGREIHRAVIEQERGQEVRNNG